MATKMIRKCARLACYVFLIIMFPVLASAFVVNKIAIEGTNRLTPTTVLHYLGIKPGETLRERQTSALLRRLYQTGFFENISLAEMQHTLIVRVVERPTIGQLKITGNSVIPTEQLNDVMKRFEIAAGRIFKHNVIANIKQGLLHQYYQLGYFNARVLVTTTPLSHHRIALNIAISEGIPTTIRSITIIGNHVFDEKTLLKQLDFSTPGLLTWMTHRDRFSEEKLSSSLERLRFYYLDHGYLHYEVQSAQAEMTPDRHTADIVIVINEGQSYTIRDVQLSGQYAPFGEKLKKLIPIHTGDRFSRQAIMDSEKAIMSFLGEHGYLFATINLRPQLNDKKQETILVFDITLGKRVYVRHVSFLEHMRTNDEVLRREILQWESSPASMEKLESSKQHLMLLPFVKDAEMSIKPVPHKPDMVDVRYRIKEDNSATATFKVGYSQIERVIFGLGFSQKNFLGIGSTFGINFQHSRYEQFDSIE